MSDLLPLLIFGVGAIGFLTAASRWFGDPNRAVARSVTRALRNPPLWISTVGLGTFLFGAAVFGAGWYARLGWLWFVMGAIYVLAGAWFTLLGPLTLTAAVRERIGPGLEAAKSRTIRPEDVRRSPKLLQRARVRREGAPAAAVALLVWIWAWWPTLTEFRGWGM